MEVITCREYNRRGFERHRKAVDEWKGQSHYSTYPSIEFFIFHKLNGEPRNYGYVLATEHSGQWFKTKREAIKKMEINYENRNTS